MFTNQPQERDKDLKNSSHTLKGLEKDLESTSTRIQCGDLGTLTKITCMGLPKEQVGGDSVDTEDEDVYDGDEMHELSNSSESSNEDYHSDSTSSDDEDTIKTTALGTRQASPNYGNFTLAEVLRVINSVPSISNISIENATGVHIGNITNINGNIQIIQTVSRKKKSTKIRSTEEREECVSNDAFLKRMNFKIPKNVCSIIKRCSWLAQKPMAEYEYIKEPVQRVVISHTATESSEKEAKNKALIRDIQCFHIESRKWIDIAYNFIIGCDGNIYEGRGWGVVGAHTRGYNKSSIGVSFIGCFMLELPTQAAINAFDALMKLGVAKGHLSEDYKLLCHCQCRPTESPGRKFFEEIKKWDHFYDLEADLDD